MTIGGINSDYDLDDIHGHRVSGSLHWELNLLSVGLGGSNLRYRSFVNRAMTDTGSQYIIMPILDFEYFVEHLCEHVKEEQNQNSIINKGGNWLKRLVLTMKQYFGLQDSESVELEKLQSIK